MTIRTSSVVRPARPRTALGRIGNLDPARRLARTLAQRAASDRGDVPGWVLITLMTAGIVVALWAVASEQIVQIFTNAMAPFLGGSL
ncbi:hypothetical protein ACXET9_12325 [Brachybacterium sp. DNPG3]